MKKLWIIALCISNCVFSSCGDGGEEKNSTEIAEDKNDKKFDKEMQKDADFVVMAISAGLMEMELGRLALVNASSQEVRDMAQQMIDEHNMSNQELMELAYKKNITLPTTPDEKMQKKVKDLSGKQSQDFDKAYLRHIINEHKEDITSFKKQAEKGTDAEINAWASGKITMLQNHITMAEAVGNKSK